MARVNLNQGDIISVRTGAGGGWGDPKRRPREKTLADVRAGYMKPNIARDIYGVEV